MTAAEAVAQTYAEARLAMAGEQATLLGMLASDLDSMQARNYGIAVLTLIDKLGVAAGSALAWDIKESASLFGLATMMLRLGDTAATSFPMDPAEFDLFISGLDASLVDIHDDEKLEYIKRTEELHAETKSFMDDVQPLVEEPLVRSPLRVLQLADLEVTLKRLDGRLATVIRDFGAVAHLVTTEITSGMVAAALKKLDDGVPLEHDLACRLIDQVARVIEGKNNYWYEEEPADY